MDMAFKGEERQCKEEEEEEYNLSTKIAYLREEEDPSEKLSFQLEIDKMKVCVETAMDTLFLCCWAFYLLSRVIKLKPPAFSPLH